MISSQMQNDLLAWARLTLETYLKNSSLPKPGDLAEKFSQEVGAFVTLHNHGELRGCIGRIISSDPLWKTIQEMAIAAATEDSRFYALCFEELSQIDIEISVLSPFKIIESIHEIQVGTHGIMIRQGSRSGLLLPQVATEQGWNREEFLANACLKAGLSVEAWKDAATKIEIFSAQVFGELK